MSQNQKLEILMYSILFILMVVFGLAYQLMQV